MNLLLFLATLQFAALPATCSAVEADPRIQAVLDDAAVAGVILIRESGAASCLSNVPGAARDRFIPASTFKIFNALVGLEAGAVADEHEVFSWDGTERAIQSWNRDHDLASGMRYSAVWFYQALARRIGSERMQSWIDAVGYGNGDIAGGIDRFWLSGKLRVSPAEQIDFLGALASGTLPFSARSQEIVREIMILPHDGEGVLRAKTGWAVGSEPEIGWFVGWLERGNRRWFFATRIDMTLPEQARLRRAVTVAALESIIDAP